MATTPKINLPLIDSSMTADVPRDMNALASALDAVVETTAGAKTKADQALVSAKAFVDADLKEAPAVPISLKMGTQVIDAKETSLVNITGLKGRTLVNLLGKRSNFETSLPLDKNTALATYTLDDERIEGLRSLKIKNIHAVDRRFISFFDESSTGATFYANKYYLCIGYVKPLTKQVAVEMVGVTVTCPTLNAWNTVVLRAVPSVDSKSKINIIGTAINDEVKIAGFRWYEVTLEEFNAIPSMIADQVTAKYPYVDSLQNVANPYAIGYGENLLPPFTEWTTGNKSFASITSNYVANLSTTVQWDWFGVVVPVLPSTTYTFSQVSGANITRVETDENGTVLTDSTIGAGAFTKTFTTLPTTTYMQIRVMVEDITKPYVFKNPLLTLGTEVKPFAPRQDLMLALMTELASNIDGSIADELFERDGQYWNLAKFKRVTLDSLGGYYDHVYGSKEFKAIGMNAPSNMNGGQQGHTLIKHDGKILVNPGNDTFPNSDTWGNRPWGSPPQLVVTIPNAGSGWGDAYTPTADEIKAYFYGWKMYDTASGQTNSVYNGTAGQYKGWVRRRFSDGGYVDGTGTLPTTLAPEYTPYQLQYLLAQPVVEHVPHEGKLLLNKGANMVECGVGMEVREQLVFGEGANYDARPKYRSKNLLKSYKNGYVVPNFFVWDDNGSDAYAIGKDIFDKSATYHVTYTRLENTVPFVAITGENAANIRGTVNDLVSETATLDTRLSVVERMKAEKDANGVLIRPTLLNAWEEYDITKYTATYKKIPGTNLVLVAAVLKNGVATDRTVIWTMPVGYRPKKVFATAGISRNASSTIITAFSLELMPTGELQIGITPGGIQNAAVEFSFTYEAEQ